MVEIKLAGENAIIIYFSDPTSPSLSQKIAFYQQQLQAQLGSAIIDVVPSYKSLSITYRIREYEHEAFCQAVKQVIDNQEYVEQACLNTTVEIPVWYHPAVGLDLEKVLHDKGLTLDELVALHTEVTYYVYAIGFSPAFAFLGELSPALFQPRHATPRLKVPAGSVAIADNQTSVYPIDSPGGWHIIGRTPLDLSLKNPENLTRFNVGQQVRFKAISEETYQAMGGSV